MTAHERLVKTNNWISKWGPYVAGAAILVAATIGIGKGCYDFRSYLIDKGSEEQKEERKEEPKKAKANLEQRITKDDSFESLIDEKGNVFYHFKPSRKIEQDIYCKFGSPNTNSLFYKDIALRVREANKCKIGDRKLTGYEMLQIVDKTNASEDFPNIRILTEDEVASKREEMKGKNDKEIRELFNLDTDPPYYMFNSQDTEGAYQDTLNAARAEYQAAAKLSTLTALGYEGARKTDAWNRQCEQARMSALWDLKRQPRRR